MRRLVALILGVVAVIWLSGSPARADTLADCLGKHHVCVTSEGRSLISQGQQTQLEQAIGNDDIYLVAAASGSSGYNAAMRQIISTLGTEKKQFVVGFLDSRLKHFGAANQGVLPAGAAARPGDMQSVSRNIAEGQYRLACAEAIADGQPKPGRSPMCFFDSRHGMSEIGRAHV